jgi:hypothetical protein
MDNNILFLIAFVIVIYFLFVKESENLEPELPASEAAGMTQTQAMQGAMQGAMQPAMQPAQAPIVPPLPPITVSPQEKERIFCSLLPLTASGNLTYQGYLDHLASVNNKSQKLITPESFDKFTRIMGNLNIVELIGLMDDV